MNGTGCISYNTKTKNLVIYVGVTNTQSANRYMCVLLRYNKGIVVHMRKSLFSTNQVRALGNQVDNVLMIHCGK